MLKGKGVDEDPKGVLSIDSKTGVIKVHRKVDFEQYRVLMVRGVYFFFYYQMVYEGHTEGLKLISLPFQS